MSKSNLELVALQNAVDAIDKNVILPEFVFREKKGKCLFFQSDFLFSPEFMEIFSQLLLLDGGKVGCLVNLNQIEDKNTHIFLSADMSKNIFFESLKINRGGKFWLFEMDRFVCTSNIGEWVIYAEKENDIAVINLKINDINKYISVLKELYAYNVEDIIIGNNLIFPFSHLTSEWRVGLTTNYKN